jgi:hypothetical protein
MNSMEATDLSKKLLNSSLAADWKALLLLAADYYTLIFSLASQKLKTGNLTDEDRQTMGEKEEEFNRAAAGFQRQTVSKGVDVPLVSLEDCLKVLTQ